MVKTKPYPCTKEEIDKIISASRVNPNDEFYYVLFNVAKYTGRRLGELVGEPNRVLVEEVEYRNSKGGISKRKIYKRVKGYHGGITVRDIDFEHGMIRIKVLKHGVQKDAILLPQIAGLLKSWINKNRFGIDDYIFRGKAYRSIQEAIIRFRKYAGINHKVSFHNFRHYFVTHLLKEGYAYNEVVKFTGHRSINSLQNYDHVMPEDLREKAIPILEKL